MGTLWPLSKSATALVLNVSEWFLLVGGIILVVGLIGERKTDEKCNAKQKLWYKRFELMVVIGVAVELIADGAIFFSSRRLQSIADSQLAQADEQIVALSPRDWLIRGNVASRIEKVLSSFSGQKIDIRIGLGEPEVALQLEPNMLAGVLAIIVHRAGWTLPDGRTDLSSFLTFHQRGANVEGLAVEVKPDAPLKTQNAAKSLRDELKSRGLMIWSDELRPLPNVPWPAGDGSATIVVTIGNK